MSKDVLESMTKEDKARDYDRIYKALVEATQEMGRQSCEMEKLRKRLNRLVPERHVEVSLEARGRVALSDIYLVMPPDLSNEDIDNIVEDHGGILGFVREFEEHLSVNGNVSLVED